MRTFTSTQYMKYKCSVVFTKKVILYWVFNTLHCLCFVSTWVHHRFFLWASCCISFLFFVLCCFVLFLFFLRLFSSSVLRAHVSNISGLSIRDCHRFSLTFISCTGSYRLSVSGTPYWRERSLNMGFTDTAFTIADH